jgi:hypothetical protein
MGKRSVASFVAGVLTLALYVVSAGIALAAVLLLLAPWIPLPQPARPEGLVIGVPAAFAVDASQVSAPSIGVTAAAIRDATGILRIPASTTRVYVGGLSFALVMLAIVWFGVSQLRKVVFSLRDERPFAAANAARIRRIAYAVLAGELLRAAFTIGSNIYIARHFEAEGMSFDVRLNVSITTIVAGLIIFVLAEVFRAGTHLEEEQSLTV